MRYYVQIIVTLLLGFYVSGCGAATQQEIAPAKQKLPSWYLTPPPSDNNTLYAVGEGKDKKEALTNALSAMLATLSVSISSSYSAKTVVRDGKNESVDATYVNDIQSKVKEIRISNYEVLQAKKLGFKKYAVLVKTDKKRLFESLKNELQQKFQLLEAREKNMKNQNALQQLAFYKKIKDSLSNLENSLIVMDVLNPNFDKQSYIEKIAVFEKRYEKLRNSISFSIKTPKHAEALRDVVAKGLTREHFKIQNKKDKNHFNITIKMDTEQANAYGIHLAKAEVTLRTKDFKGVEIASNTLHLTGQSSASYTIAKQDLAKRLDEKIKEQGIAKVLNLNL